LGHRYFHGARHQPIGTLAPRHANPQLRFRHHAKALTVVPSTHLNTSDSALERLIRAWNDIPSDLAKLPYGQLKAKLRSLDYHSESADYVAMQHSIRVL
jgi:hypothetical protein